MNKEHISEVMQNEKVRELWEMDDSDFTPDERLFSIGTKDCDMLQRNL